MHSLTILNLTLILDFDFNALGLLFTERLVLFYKRDKVATFECAAAKRQKAEWQSVEM